VAAAERKRGAEPDDSPGKRKGRIARHFRMGREVVRQPRQAIPLAREALVEAWRARGGGFYGLGYLIAFCWLQFSVLVGDVSESDSVSQFAMGAAIEYLLRFSLMAFVNVFLALLWPFYVLEQFGGTGIILLAIGYLTFEYGLRPLIEQTFPELRGPDLRGSDLRGSDLRGSDVREKASQNPEQ